MAFGATPAANTTISVESKQSIENRRHEFYFCAWLMDSPRPTTNRSIGSNEYLFWFDFMSEALHAGSKETQPSSSSANNRMSEFSASLRSAHAQPKENEMEISVGYTCALPLLLPNPLIPLFALDENGWLCSYRCFGLPTKQISNKFSLEPMLGFGQCRCHAQKEYSWRNIAFDCWLSVELDDFYCRRTLLSDTPMLFVNNFSFN